jgi:filamentous hemagglutinin family protein
MKRIAAKFLMSLGLVGLGAGHTFGNPTGGSIAAGSATITTAPGTVTINQASNTAIINWQTFSIAAGELTKFVQPSAASAALNRVVGGGTSIIDGSLEANGQIFIINGNGIVIGPSGLVNTNSFIASTRDIADSDFLAGNLHFTGSNSAGVQNAGTIAAQCGDVYLIGKTVDNEGTISAPNGTAGLAAGDDVLLTQAGAQHVFVNPTATATSATGLTAVTNGGKISAAQAELAAANGNVYALAINNAGTIRATAVSQKGGRVFLTTDTGVVENNGTICAQNGGNGGAIQITGGSVWNRKTLNASGATGGRVQIQAANVQNDGAISARGTASYGGNVYITFTGNALASITGSVDASGWTGGGSIDFIGTGSTSEAYLSMGLNVTSNTGQGGRMVVDSASVYLAGAKLSANGPGGNGDIFLGVSDPVYSVTPVVAQTLYIGLGTTITANATAVGNGGTIIAQGTNTSENFGTVTATGRGLHNHDGTVTVPPTPVAPPVVATTVGAVGTGTSTGGGGSAKPAPAFEFLDPDPGANNAFGRPVTGLFNLASNTTLVTSPGDSFGGAGAGAAYLFNDSTGALLSTIRGTSAGDGVGTTVQLLTPNTFAVETPGWSNGMGAITFGNGLRGFANGGGNVSAANSLIGSATGDEVGSGGLVKLFNGNYVALSPNWSGGAGAVTFVNPVAGITGAVGAGNSLVGGTAGDQIGSGGIEQLNNGANFLVMSPTFAGGKGAITNGSDTTGVIGVVSSDNSLVGASTTDHVGAAGSIIDTIYGYYLAVTSNYGGGAGAVTWNSSAGGTTGVVGLDNSLVGAAGGDHIGSGGITILNDDHNYVVDSPDWNNNAGAVTLGIGSVGASGVVGAGNSLVGAAGGDRAGSGGIDPLAGTGAFAIFSPDFNNNAGAVTLANDAHGVAGAISSGNSLVGANSNDQIGSGGITILGSGNIVVLSPQFDGSAGAVTFGDVPGSLTGVVSATNSLVGSTGGDEVGSGGVIQLSNGGNFVVLSPNWDGGKGAITNGDDYAGVHGVVSATNSLVGANAGDHVGAAGSVLDPFTGYYIVTTANYGGGAGAVTWNNDAGGTVGTVGAATSLVGATGGDHIGSGGVQILYDGNYVVLSPEFGGGAGAATWGSAFGGVHGTVGQGNSLVGAAAGDHVGSAGIFQLSNSANYLVLSPDFNGGAGAVTNGSSGTGIAGVVGAGNSLVGAAGGDGVGVTGSIIDSFDNYYLVTTANYGGGAGAVTWNADDSGVVGAISAGNSLVGSAAGDHVGSGGVKILDNGNYVVDSPNWNNLTGAVTVGLANGGVKGTIQAANSLVGGAAGDQVGSLGITLLPGGDFLVDSPNFDAHAGAVTWVNAATGLTGVVSAANSLVGAAGGDLVGSDGIVLLNNHANYVVLSAHFNDAAGAITEGSDTAGITGVVGTGNSLLGANSGDGVGTTGSILDTSYGYYLVVTRNFGGGAGAVTYNYEAHGTTGLVSAANSLVGSVAGDAVGSGGITFLTGNHGYVVSSPNWNGGAGASTFGSVAGGITGVVGATNSLVGAAGGDHIGSGGLLLLANGDYLVLSPDFNGSSGAVTFAGGTGRVGVVGAANSLVGTASGDMIGNGGIAELANGNYLVLSPDFGGGLGAVTFGTETGGVAGLVGAANSLVGVNGGDHVGSGGIIFLSNGNYLVQSPDFGGSAGAVTWGSAAGGVVGEVTTLNSIVGGMPDAGEEYGGESANGDVYFVSFTTDSSEGGQGRVVVGSTDGPTATPELEDFFLLPAVNTVEASGFNFIAGANAFYVADPNAPPHGTSDVDSPTDSAINAGSKHNDLASGSSAAFIPGHQRLVTPGNGVWNIFGGLVHSAPPPLWISRELQLTLSPAVYERLNDILFGGH